MICCIHGTKIGDSMIRKDDKSLQFVIPDTFYSKGLVGFWQLKRIGNKFLILRFLDSTRRV